MVTGLDREDALLVIVPGEQIIHACLDRYAQNSPPIFLPKHLLYQLHKPFRDTKLGQDTMEHIGSTCTKESIITY